jgi:glycosyltransferase involved in cell wall biosynthesis
MRRKGLDLLLRALPLVQRTMPGAHLRLIGPCNNPDYLHELRALADELGVSGSVDFSGPRHGDVLRAEYASASVVALPSREENVPVAIAEAMAVGRPVVATRVGGVADLVTEGITGFLVPPDNVQELAKALSAILANEAGGREMGVRAQAIAQQRFELDSVVERHLAVYRAMRFQPAR